MIERSFEIESSRLRNWDRDFGLIWQGRDPRAPAFRARHGKWPSDNARKMSMLLVRYVERLLECESDSASSHLDLAEPLLKKLRSVSLRNRRAARHRPSPREDFSIDAVDSIFISGLLLRWLERIEACQRYVCSKNNDVFVRAREKITLCKDADQLRGLDPRRLAVRLQQSPDQVKQLENLLAAIKACISIQQIGDDAFEIEARRNRLLALANDCKYSLEGNSNGLGEIARQLMKKVALEGLAKDFRIVQWEVMVRELAVEQSEGGGYRYRFLGSQLQLDEYMTLPMKFHDALSTAGFMATQLYETNSCLRYTSHFADQEWMIDFRKNRHAHCNKAFKKGIDDAEIDRRYPAARSDQIKNFVSANRRFPSMRPDVATVLVHDGEFTFYSMIWLFRYYHAKCSRIGVKACFEDLDKSMVTRSTLKQSLEEGKRSNPYQLVFDEETGKLYPDHVVMLMYQLGIGILIEEQESNNVLDWQVVMTERYDSFLEWLNTMGWAVKSVRSNSEEDRQNPFSGLTREQTVELICDISKTPTRWHAFCNDYLDMLPVKSLPVDDYSEAERRWITALVGYFLSSVPHQRFDNYVAQRIEGCKVSKSKGTRLWTTLREQLHFFEKVDGLNWLELLVSPSALYDEEQEKTLNLKMDEPDACHVDRLTCRLARVPYFPLEMMFRAYQTYQMHLLIMPQNFIHSPWQRAMEDAPSSVTFVTLAGHLPLGVFEDIQFGQHLKVPECLKNEGLFWLIPYWNLFYPIASSFAMQTIEEGARQGGMQDATFSASAPIHHEMKRIFDAFRPGMPDFVVNEIRNYLMFFSMHSAYTVDRPDTLESVVCFKAQESFREFFERAQRYVMKSEAIVEAARKNKFHIATSENAPEFLALMESYGRKIEFRDVPDDLFVLACDDWKPEYGINDHDTKRRCKFLLFAMCVAAISNIKKNSDRDVVIVVSVSQDQRLLSIENASQNEGPAKKTGTLSVLRGIASELGPLAAKSVTLQRKRDAGTWLTTLPIPQICIG